MPAPPRRTLQGNQGAVEVSPSSRNTVGRNVQVETVTRPLHFGVQTKLRHPSGPTRSPLRPSQPRPARSRSRLPSCRPLACPPAPAAPPARRPLSFFVRGFPSSPAAPVRCLPAFRPALTPTASVLAPLGSPLLLHPPGAPQPPEPPGPCRAGRRAPRPLPAAAPAAPGPGVRGPRAPPPAPRPRLRHGGGRGTSCTQPPGGALAALFPSLRSELASRSGCPCSPEPAPRPAPHSPPPAGPRRASPAPPPPRRCWPTGALRPEPAPGVAAPGLRGRWRRSRGRH